ncbi:MAG: FtsX-like permease family protein [Gaiellaceae bacterium]|jgi:putative ABC transport system permease protein
MIRITLRGLLTRKLRSSLTAIAIVLGVAMISGTYVLTDTINSSFSSLYQQIYKGTDAYITGKSVVKNQMSGVGITPSFPESLLAKVKAVPGVKAAVGGVTTSATSSVSVVGKNGKVIANGGAPNIGVSVDNSVPELRTVTLVSGTWPNAGEVVIDQGTAKKSGYKVGDRIGILAPSGPVRKMRLSGIIKFGKSNAILGATLAGFDLKTAQQLLNEQGKLDYISVVAKPGFSPEQLVKSLRPVLPASVMVRTGSQEASQQSADTSRSISAIQYFLLAFAGIALFVGIFVIINTLSITVAQRTREFATLRTLGGSRIQVLLSIVMEALIVGAIASITGLFLGFGLAEGLMKLFKHLGLELPNAFVIEPRTVWVALGVGIVVTLIASIRPALRATRVPPIAAVREGAVLPPSRFHRFRTAGSLALAALGFLLLLQGLFGHGMSTGQILGTLGAGAVLIFIGVALVAARVIKPIARAVSPLGMAAVVLLSVVVWPITFFIWLVKLVFGRRPEFPGVTPDRTMNTLALANSGRNPERTASSAAALMIGLALVTLVAVLSASLIGSFKGAVDAIFTGDYAVTAVNQSSASGVPIAASDAVAKVPGVEAISSARAGFALVYRKSAMVSALDGQPSQVFRLKWKQGSQSVLDSLGASGAIVADRFASSHHLKLGSPIKVVPPSGVPLNLTVDGIFKPPTGGSPFGAVTFSAQTFDANFQSPSNMYTLLKMRGGGTAANSKALDKALAGFPNAQAQTRQQFVNSQIAQLNPILMVFYVLLAFSILISFVGIVVMLVLTVYERTRELGMLRAIGITQRQTRRMIRHESVITAMIGGALGIALGLVFGILLVHRMPYVSFSLPVGQLILCGIAAVIIGIIAALLPARRAARLNVLEALQYE